MDSCWIDTFHSFSFALYLACGNLPASSLLSFLKRYIKSSIAFQPGFSQTAPPSLLKMTLQDYVYCLEATIRSFFEMIRNTICFERSTKAFVHKVDIDLSLVTGIQLASYLSDHGFHPSNLPLFDDFETFGGTQNFIYGQKMEPSFHESLICLHHSLFQAKLGNCSLFSTTALTHIRPSKCTVWIMQHSETSDSFFYWTFYWETVFHFALFSLYQISLHLMESSKSFNNLNIENSKRK